MKNLMTTLLAISLFSQSALADTCDFSTGITPGPNHTFIYTEACHQAVGALVAKSDRDDAQISDLKKAIDLKDLAIAKSDDRTKLWMDTSASLEDRLTKVDGQVKHNEALYFVLGIATAIGTGFMVGSLARH